MEKYEFGDFQVEIDEEATQAWYEKSEEWDCTCGHCRNFVLLAKERRLPAELLELLDKLCVFPAKPAYVCQMDEKDGKLLYQLTYCLPGRVIQGPAQGSAPFPWGEVNFERESAPHETPAGEYFDMNLFLWLPWADGVPLHPHQIILSSDLEENTTELENLLRRVIPAALSLEGVTAPWEVDVLITDDAGIQAINRDMREVDAPTDVLSFPMFDFAPGDKPTEEDIEPGSGLVPLGDMVLNIDRIRSQGEEYGHGPVRETAYLAVHSVLHLLGYDHLDEGPMKAQMRAREEAILDKLGILR